MQLDQCEPFRIEPNQRELLQNDEKFIVLAGRIEPATSSAAHSKPIKTHKPTALSYFCDDNAKTIPFYLKFHGRVT